MARTNPRTTSARSGGDRSAQESELAALRRENAELKARLAKGPADESWFTPGVLAFLAFSLFVALWVKYSPLRRARTPAAPTAASAAAR